MGTIEMTASASFQLIMNKKNGGAQDHKNRRNYCNKSLGNKHLYRIDIGCEVC